MTVGCTDRYLEKDGAPWLPVSGEMQYSRTWRRNWRRSLYTMKACGVDVVASYVFWIHHEEIEGRYDFSGNRDLRAFVSEVKEAGMSLLLRIGPWVHGEARNGGFPDWLFDKSEREGFALRRSNPGYLAEVSRWYKTLFEQVRGFLVQDGGPIIGVQIENEYSGRNGQNAPEGDEHIRALTALAVEAGFRVPIYTATGWGHAGTGDCLKVWGGYAAEPWSFSYDKLPPSRNFRFSYYRNDSNIGALEPVGEAEDDPDDDGRPFLTAELGGGVQITDARRPILTAKDNGALTLTKLGSGANMLGYYIFHGGTNPKGVLTTLEECPNRVGVAGCYCRLPQYGYDFQAPIGEFGQCGEKYAEMRKILSFVRDFGGVLATMRPVLPEDGPKRNDDLETLRTALRTDGRSGFLFVNNYVRGYPMRAHKNVTLTARLRDETVTFPATDIADGDYFVWPVNLPVGDGLLACATASPLMVLDGKTVFFYGKREPEFRWKREPTDARVIWLDERDALRAQKITAGGRDYCVLSDATLLATGGDEIEAYSEENPLLCVYPELPSVPPGFRRLANRGEFAVYEKETPDIVSVRTEVRSVHETEQGKVFDVEIAWSGAFPEDILLDIDYAGNAVRVRVDGEILTDNYYNGVPLTVGLARCAFPRRIEVEIDTLAADKKVYLESDPRPNGASVCELRGLRARPLYRTGVRFS